MRETRQLHTLFNKLSPGVVVKSLAESFLATTGWSIRNDMPDEIDKCVLIGAPHTSNWDFIMTLAIATRLDLTFSWVGKQSLFRPPFGPLMQQLGGIPIDRSSSHNYVEQIAAKIREANEIALVIAPEGTRSKTDRWKSGFYWIAKEADVPIVLGVVDYGRKIGGLGPAIYPIGSKKEVMDQIRAFYTPEMSRYPEQYTVPRLRDE